MNTYEVDVIRPGMEREYFAYRNHNRLAANGNMVVDPATLWNRGRASQNSGRS